MNIAGLDKEASPAFIYEIDAARHLLAYGLKVVRSDALTANTRDPIMTMLSSGLEKLYKLTLGLIALDRDNRWASKAEMKQIGHKIGEMHPVVLAELVQRVKDKPPYVQQSIETVSTDPVLPTIMNCLDSYGREGRFFYLDLLAGEPQQRSSPHESWRAIETEVLADPDVRLSVKANRSVGDSEQWRTLRLAVGERIDASLTSVWTSIALCARHGALGEAGRVFGLEVHPDSVGRLE